jgi:hypothetical protein
MARDHEISIKSRILGCSAEGGGAINEAVVDRRIIFTTT